MVPQVLTLSLALCSNFQSFCCIYYCSFIQKSFLTIEIESYSSLIVFFSLLSNIVAKTIATFYFRVSVRTTFKIRSSCVHMLIKVLCIYMLLLLETLLSVCSFLFSLSWNMQFSQESSSSFAGSIQCHFFFPQDLKNVVITSVFVGT